MPPKSNFLNGANTMTQTDHLIASARPADQLLDAIRTGDNLFEAVAAFCQPPIVNGKPLEIRHCCHCGEKIKPGAAPLAWCDECQQEMGE